MGGNEIYYSIMGNRKKEIEKNFFGQHTIKVVFWIIMGLGTQIEMEHTLSILVLFFERSLPILVAMVELEKMN